VADCCLAVILVVLVAVLVVILVLIVVLILVVVVLIVLVLVLVFHFNILQVFVLRISRYSSIPRILGFILRFENQTDQKSAKYGGGNTTGGGF
jgi:hypothetical protein